MTTNTMLRSLRCLVAALVLFGSSNLVFATDLEVEEALGENRVLVPYAFYNKSLDTAVVASIVLVFIGATYLKNELLVIDGGMGGELQRRSGHTGGLWSAQALLDDPELVSKVHTDYVTSGADIIITNTYATIPSYLSKCGMQNKYVELADVAAKIARKVADEAPNKVLIAGSLPPLGESYRWDLVPANETAQPIYQTLAQTLHPYVDLFLCETMSCVRESVNAVSAARHVAGSDMPVWVSWTLAEEPGGGLRSGETVAEALGALADYDVDAYLFNCTTPEAITTGVAELTELTDKPIGAYPNLFHVPEGWTLDNDLQVERSEMSVETFLSFASAWQKAGVSMIGGCCGIGPEFIHALSSSKLSGCPKV